MFTSNLLQGQKFTCSVMECGKMYSRMDNLKAHLLSAHGIDDRKKKHKFCFPLCEENFYHATSLTSHMGKAHDVPVGKSIKSMIRWHKLLAVLHIITQTY